MNKKLSFFESIYLNKVSKQLLNTETTKETTKEHNVNNKIDNSTQTNNIDTLSLGVLSASTTSESNTDANNKVDLTKTLSQDIEIVNDTNNQMLNENKVDLSNSVDVLDDTLNLDNDSSLNKNSDDTNLLNIQENQSDNLNETFSLDKPKKKKKKKNKISSLVNSDDEVNNSIGIRNAENESENKNTQSNIKGIDDVLNKIVANSTEQTLIDTDVDLAENDDLFLQIEIPAEELNDLNLQNDINEYNLLDLDTDLDTNLGELEENHKDLHSEAFSSNNLDELEVNPTLTSNSSVVEELSNNENSSVIHFDLDDQLSEVDLDGGLFVDEKIKDNYENNNFEKNNFENNNLNSSDDLSNSKKISDYDPKYRNAFDEDVQVEDNQEDITETSTNNQTTNSSFALLEDLPLDENEAISESKNDDEETTINIPML